MQTTPQTGPLPPGGTAREEIAKREIGVTTISPGLARALMIAFLLAIGVVPMLEWRATVAQSGVGAASAWSQLIGVIDRLPATAAQVDGPDGPSGLWQRALVVNRELLSGLVAFERGLEDESFVGKTLRPPFQGILSGWLGAGNERAYIGRDGWLFYRPDVEYLTGPGFLSATHVTRRVAAATEWEQPPQTDPRTAIVHFKRQLDARGILLIVVPTPAKSMIHPSQLAARYDPADAPLENASFALFVDDLRREGVVVYEPAHAIAAASREFQQPQYLATDTHWRPEAMELIARGISDLLGERASLPAVPDPGYRAARREVRGRGDIALMLDLPSWQTLYPPELVLARSVTQSDGTAWRPSRDADILLLGDSFANIYSLESMGWSDSAGLAEQLAYLLQRPVDRIVQNDQGSFATRALLARSPGRLDGKRVVIYQFAARELAFGDWQLIEHSSSGVTSPTVLVTR